MSEDAAWPYRRRRSVWKERFTILHEFSEKKRLKFLRPRTRVSQLSIVFIPPSFVHSQHHFTLSFYFILPKMIISLFTLSHSKLLKVSETRGLFCLAINSLRVTRSPVVTDMRCGWRNQPANLTGSLVAATVGMKRNSHLLVRIQFWSSGSVKCLFISITPSSTRTLNGSTC